MTRRRVSEHIEDNTPRNIDIGSSWARLIFWAFGQYGPWVLFVGSTWFLYQDNKTMQASVLEVTKAQIAVNAQVVTGLSEMRRDFADELKELNKAITTMNEDARKAHTSPQR